MPATAAAPPNTGGVIAPPPLIEVIVLGAADALQAESAGAHRLEVVSAMECGGLTPPVEVVRAIARGCSSPTMVMARPHARSLVYDEADMRPVHESVAMARDAGANGLVFGSLTASEGRDMSRDLVRRCRHGSGTEPLVGSGVNSENIAELQACIGAGQYRVGSGARVGSRFDAGLDNARMTTLLNVR